MPVPPSTTWRLQHPRQEEICCEVSAGIQLEKRSGNWAALQRGTSPQVIEMVIDFGASCTANTKWKVVLCLRWLRDRTTYTCLFFKGHQWENFDCLEFLDTTLKLDSYMGKKLHLCCLSGNPIYFLGAVLITSEMTWMWLLHRNPGISLGVQKSQKPLVLQSASPKGSWDTIRVLTHQLVSCETSLASASCFAAEQQNQRWSWDIKQPHTCKWNPGS